MAKTETVLLDETWKEVAGGCATVAAQLAGQGTFRVVVLPAGASPSPEARGIVYSNTVRGLPAEFSADGLPEGTQVFMRAFDEKTVEVEIMAY